MSFTATSLTVRNATNIVKSLLAYIDGSNNLSLGHLFGGIRRDTRASGAAADGDYAIPGFDAQGSLYTVTAEKQATVSASPTCDTSAYAAGDLIGGKLSFASASRFSGGSGRIGNVLLVDQAKQQIEADPILFGADPTGTTFTDQAAFDIADADMDKIVAVVNLAFYTAFNDNAIAQYTPPAGIPFKLTSGTTLYGAIVTRGAPTYAASTDLKAILTITQD